MTSLTHAAHSLRLCDIASAARALALEAAAFLALQARACVFAGSFFVLLAASRWLPLGGMPRYDALLLAALALQWAMVRSGLETRDELRTIGLFHAVGLALELFKTHPAIGSWSYPESAFSKLAGVPLYAGFMYAAVASYLMQAWRLFDVRLERCPGPLTTLPLAAAIYANFFSHHFLGDQRWGLAAGLLAVFWRTRVRFTAHRRERAVPLLACFAAVGALLWIAENLATYLGAWVYPNQAAGWQPVHVGKATSWTLLVVISFVAIADLKHFKARRAARAAASLR